MEPDDGQPIRCLWCGRPTFGGVTYCSTECQDQADSERLKDRATTGKGKKHANPVILGAAYMSRDPHHGVSREGLKYKGALEQLGR